MKISLKGGDFLTDIEYIERTIKQLIEELKEKNCLSQEFQFLTKAEREAKMERTIDEFLKNH